MSTEENNYKIFDADDSYGGYLNLYTEETTKNKEVSEESKNLESAKEKFKLIVENARKKSKTNVEIIYDNKKRIKTTVGEVSVRITSAVLVIVLAGTAIVSGIKYAPEIIDKLTYHAYVTTVSREESIEAGTMLSEAGLNVVPQDDYGNWFNNYDKLENVTEDDLYGFYCYFGKAETENVVKRLGYSNWDNFLSMNGYFDENGTPSIEVWLNYQEKAKVDEYKANR